jgi:hypothetical protein
VGVVCLIDKGVVGSNEFLYRRPGLACRYPADENQQESLNLTFRFVFIAGFKLDVGVVLRDLRAILSRALAPA